MYIATNSGTIFKVELIVKNERFEDLLVSALEGGSNYWLFLNAYDIAIEAAKLDGEFNIIKQIMMGGSTNCYDAENQDEKLGELSLHRMRSALQSMANGKDLKGKENEHLKTHFNNFVTGDDDAETADVIIQIAIMGEIVFS